MILFITAKQNSVFYWKDKIFDFNDCLERKKYLALFSELDYFA